MFYVDIFHFTDKDIPTRLTAFKIVDPSFISAPCTMTLHRLHGLWSTVHASVIGGLAVFVVGLPNVIHPTMPINN